MKPVISLAFFLTMTAVGLAAEPDHLYRPKAALLQTTNVPPGPTVEERLAELTALVQAQSAQIDQLKQQLQTQATVIATQSVDIAEVTSSIASLAQVITFDDGVMTINFSEITIQSDLLNLSASAVDVLGNTDIKGIVSAESVITKSVISESYTPGAGNVW